MRIVSVGEVLWDVIGDTEFLGGAPLNFAANLQRLGNSVVLLTAVGDDSRGRRVLAQMRELGLTTEYIQIVTEQPTGTAEVSTDASGSASFLIRRPAAFDLFVADDSTLARLRLFRPDWIYFGTLAQVDAHGEEALLRIIDCAVESNRFYDMNLRAGHWNIDLIERLSRLATVVKLNDAEAELLFQLTFETRQFSLEEFCHYWSSKYGVNTICVTLGSKGCAVFSGEVLNRFPGYPVTVADTVGAGDAFAAAFLHGLHLGWPIGRIAQFANALGAHVASRSGATPPWTLAELELTKSSTEV